MEEAANGDILLQSSGGKLRMKRPVVYQELTQVAGTNVAGKRRVDGAYILEADGWLGFRIGPHDPHAALIIDPSLSVAYATFLGGTGADVAASVALDGAGKVYVGGTTTSPGTFPGTSRALGPGGGTSEFFVAKLDPTVTGANSLVYLTFLGGSQTQIGGMIAVTSAGSVAITGTTTSPDYPVTDSKLPTNALTSGVGNDVAVSEIDPYGQHARLLDALRRQRRGIAKRNWRDRPRFLRQCLRRVRHEHDLARQNISRPARHCGRIYNHMGRR